MNIPKLIKQQSRTILLVDDKPFIALAGEVHNSDSSDPDYMEHIWNIADNLGMNTLLLPVTWEMVEPVEGRFDFSVAEQLIRQARSWNKKIGFLWFGSWKNAECSYAPSWVKTDLDRFKRAQIEKGKNKAGRKISDDLSGKAPYTSLSYLCEESMRADAKAFAALMEFIRDFDKDFATVISVQVENETGLLGNAREVSDDADALFCSSVPQDFIRYMKEHTDTMVKDVKEAVIGGAESGAWSEVFGAAAEEIFSAYYISGYVNFVAQAGKEVYPLPMTANCWLDQGGDPGQYPSGGPVSRMYEVWQYRAPMIDILCPDIYVRAFKDVCDEYTRRGTPLYIPETATHSYCAPRMVYTVGHYHAICYAPFGFDDIGKPFTAMQGILFGMDVTDPALATPQNFEEYGATGKLLQGLLSLIGAALGSENLDAACGELGAQSAMTFGDLRVTAFFKSHMQNRSDGYCLCVKTAEDECYLLGNACAVTLTSADPAKESLDLLSAEEIMFDDKGKQKMGRRLNGDETAYMCFNKPGIMRLKYFLF